MAWLSAFTERKRRVIGMSSGVIEGDEIVILEGPLMNRTGWIRKIDRRKRVAYLEMRMFAERCKPKLDWALSERLRKENSAGEGAESYLTDAEALRLLAGCDSGVRPELSRRGYRFAKRAFDLVG